MLEIITANAAPTPDFQYGLDTKRKNRNGFLFIGKSSRQGVMGTSMLPFCPSMKCLATKCSPSMGLPFCPSMKCLATKCSPCAGQERSFLYYKYYYSTESRSPCIYSITVSLTDFTAR